MFQTKQEGGLFCSTAATRTRGGGGKNNRQGFSLLPIWFFPSQWGGVGGQLWGLTPLPALNHNINFHFCTEIKCNYGFNLQTGVSEDRQIAIIKEECNLYHWKPSENHVIPRTGSFTRGSFSLMLWQHTKLWETVSKPCSSWGIPPLRISWVLCS